MGADGFSAATTQDEPLTARGTLLGTLQYMAPEQLEGKEADHRTDIFAFGALVYEMATGQRAFSGESQASLIGAILKDELPPMSTLQPVTPARLDEIVKTCLAKDPDDRWQSAGDIGRQVQGIIEGGSQPSVAAPMTAASERRGWPQAAPWVATVVLAVTTGLAVWISGRPPAPRLAQFVLAPPAGETIRIALQARSVAITPDGTGIVFPITGQDTTARWVLKSLETLVPEPLDGLGSAPYNPFFSPDGAWLGFGTPRTPH